MSVDSLQKMKSSQEWYKTEVIFLGFEIFKCSLNVNNLYFQKNGFGPRKQRSVACLDNEDYGDMMKSMLSILESPVKKNTPKRLASIETLGAQREEDQVSGSDR